MDNSKQTQHFITLGHHTLNFNGKYAEASSTVLLIVLVVPRLTKVVCCAAF